MTGSYPSIYIFRNSLSIAKRNWLWVKIQKNAKQQILPDKRSYFQQDTVDCYTRLNMRLSNPTENKVLKLLTKAS